MRFAVLGPLHVAGEEVSRHLAGHKERAVLAILLARGAAGATGDELVAALWGAQPPPSAERSLQAHVSRVRSSVAPTPVVRRPEGWFLDASDEVDAARFEGFLDRARRAARQEAWVETGGLVESALALWRGEPFGGFAHLDPCAVEADRLRTLKAEAEELAMVSRLALGEASTLVDGLRQMTAAEPFREDRWSLLMTALYRAGRQAEALAAYDEARRLLADELGIDPSPELRTRRQQVLEQDPALRAPLRSVRASLPDAPYRGLAAYRDRDAGVFVGRERLLARVLDRVAETRVVTLAGVSGSGKSSLLQAGLLPALRAGDLPGSEGWRIVVATPGTLDTEKAGADLVVLDQAEELFTVLEDERRAELARALAAAVVGGGRLVLAIRADHWARCADLPELAELVGESSLLVPAMTEDELRRVVLEPARRFGVEVEAAVVDLVLADAQGREGGLPLVSTALTRAWERARSGRVTVEDLQASGGVADAVASLAEEAWQSLCEGEQATARAVLLRLAADSDGSVVRRRVPEAALVADVPAAAGVLGRLTSGRLVTVGDHGVEVVHEALFTAWPRLAGWLEEDAVGRRLRSHLTPAAAEWAARGRQDDDLYRGARLAEAVSAAMHDPIRRGNLSAQEAEFLEASERAADRSRLDALSRSRRLRVLLAVAVTLGLVAAVVALVAVRSRDRAVVAETRADAGRLAAEALLEVRPDVALLLAAQSMALDDAPATRSSLFGVLQRQPRLLAITSVGQRTTAMRMAPDGRSLSLCTTSGELSSWDSTTLERIRTLRPAGGSFCGPQAHLDDGTVIATVRQRESAGADLEVRSSSDGALLSALPIDDGWWTFAAPDSSAIVTGAVLGSYLATRDGDEWSVRRLGGDATPTPIGSDGRFAWSQPGRPIQIRALPQGDVVSRVTGTRGHQARAITADGELAVTVDDAELRLLDSRTGAVRLVVPAPGPYGDVFFAADDRLLVTSTATGEADVWSRSTGRPLVHVEGAGDGGLSVDVTPDGTRLLTLAGDGTLAAWDLTGEQTFGETRSVPRNILVAAYDDVAGVVVVGTTGGTVAHLDPTDLSVLAEVEIGGRVVDVEPAGDELVVVADEEVIRLDDSLSVLQRRPVAGASAVAWDPESGLALSTRQGRSLELTGPDGGRTTVALSDVTSLGGPVQAELWGQLAWSPDGTLLAAGANDGTVRVLDAAGRSVATVPGDEAGVSPAVAFLGDGRLVAGDRRGRVRLWDPRTGEPLASPLGAGSGVPRVLADAGDLLAVGTTQAEVALLDVSAGVRYGGGFLPGNGERLVPLFAEGGALIVFSPDGSAQRWPASVAEWAERACRLAGRRLSAEEWERYLPGRPYDPAC